MLDEIMKDYSKTEPFKKAQIKYRNSLKGKATRKKYSQTHKSGYQKEYLRKIRNSVVEILGGVCIKCGFSDIRALQIDHINGGGSKERKSGGYVGNFHKHVLRSVLNQENKYQLLCANCNWIKRVENKEQKK